MQIVELEMVPLSLRPVLQRLYDMKTTQSALREGVLFSTKVSEIADFLNISPGNVKVRLHRARKIILTGLEENGNE